ncbi:MAG: type IV pilus modification PilV family protein [Limisphaerales bacterium]
MKPTPNRAGFSLIEVLCAILVLGVGVAGLTEGIAAALRSGKDAQLQTAAMLQAAGLVDTLLAEGDVIDGVSEGECGAGLAPHRWRQTLSPTDLDGLHDLVVVIEDGRSGKTICELRTLVFEVPGGSLSSDSERGSGTDRRRRERDGRRP